MSEGINEWTPSEAGEIVKCGLVMPISAIDTYTEKHWDNIRDIIKESLSGLNFEIKLVSDSNDSGVIQSRIVQNLFDSDIVICDVSAKNPNVMFELGMRLAFDKPVVIIKDSTTTFSFDIAVIEHLEYPRDLHYNSIVTFKEKLRHKVLGTIEASGRPEYTTFLKHFAITEIARIETREVDPYEFIIQSLADIRGDISNLNKRFSGAGNVLSEDVIDLSKLAAAAANEFIQTSGEIGNLTSFLNSDIVANLRMHYPIDDKILTLAFKNETLAYL